MLVMKRPLGGILLEVILGLALSSLLIQIIAVSGMSAYRTSLQREYRMQAQDLCSMALSEVQRDPSDWAPSRSVTRDAQRGDFAYKVSYTTQTVQPGLLKAQIDVTWQRGPIKHSASREAYMTLEETP